MLNFTIRPLAETDLSEWLRLRSLLWDASSENDHKSEMLEIIEDLDSQYVVVCDLGEGRLAALFLLLGGVLYVRHAENIGRLARGEEMRIGEKR